MIHLTDSKVIQIASSVLAGLFGAIETSVIFAIPALILIFIDVYSAHCLGVRVARKYPNHADGKFKSEHKKSVGITFVIFFGVMVIAAYADTLVLRDVGQDYGVRAWCIAFGFYQLWSILENWSSENNASIPRALQRIMVNKAERHLNVPLADILLNQKSKENGESRNFSPDNSQT